MRVYRLSADGGAGADLDKIILANDVTDVLEQIVLPKKYSDTKVLKITYVGEM